MMARISRSLFESYLNCPMKGHLKYLGQVGVKTDYEKLLGDSREEVRRRAIERILRTIEAGEVVNNVALTTPILKKGTLYILGGDFESDTISLHFDGIKRIDGESKLGSFHYVPMLFHEVGNAKQQKVLLRIYGYILGQLQGRPPAIGLVWRGNEIKPIRMHLGAGMNDVQHLIDDFILRNESKEPPKLILNEHCSICEYRERCQSQARLEDNLSQLRGIGAKEIARFSRKGIFTLTQLAHTFRPRRKGKGQGTSNAHSHALKAMAIMAKKVYV